MGETAWEVHRIAGRLRLRFPGRRKDAAFFADLVRRIGGIPGVERAEANPLTAGILIEHAPAAGPDLDRLLDAAGIEVRKGTPPLEPARARLGRGAESLDRGLRGISDGAADLRTLGGLAFLGLTLVQVSRGEVLAPAASMLWYAMEMLRADERPRDRESGQ